MLRIAICDDMPDQLTAIAEFTKEYIAANNLNASLRQFAHPDELMTACESEPFHIYILDIVMPMMSGIDVGKEIRQRDKQAQIIYTTTEPSFALESFQANPINYLIKPLNQKKLFETLDLALTKLNVQDEAVVPIKTKEGIRVIKLSSIIFCEYTNHVVKYTLVGKEILTTRSLKESFSKHMIPLLKDKRFLQPHNSFVINITRVDTFSKNGFVMSCGNIIPISMKQYPSVRDTYMDYLLAREEL